MVGRELTPPFPQKAALLFRSRHCGNSENAENCRITRDVWPPALDGVLAPAAVHC